MYSAISRKETFTMPSALLRLREASHAFSVTEQSAAQLILEKPELVEQLSIRELAHQAYVSPSTILRMCTHAGYSGYKDFRKAVSGELLLRKQNLEQEKRELGRSDTLEEIVDKITYRNILSLEQTKDLLDLNSLRKSLELLKKARFVYLFGMGASLCTAKDAYLKFLRINKPCFVNDDWHSQLVQARNASPEDLGIVFSYSGQTTEMIECMKILKENGTPVIAVTRCVNSPVSSMADQNLYTAANEAIFRSGAMSSRISQLNIIDILSTAYANSQYEQSVRQISKTHIKKPGDHFEEDQP